MHNEVMRTTVNLDDDVHEYATVYANANGISLSAALNELIETARQAKEAPKPEPKLLRGPHGLPMFPPTGGRISSEMIKKIEEEEFDPQKYS
jgi:hypothetical protein